MNEREQQKAADQFETELEALITRQHTIGLHGGLVLARLSCQFCRITIESGLPWGAVVAALRETWLEMRTELQRERGAKLS